MPTTDQPTNITSSSATLNGTLNDLQTASSLDVYFEWGTDTTYGNTTATETISSVPTSFSADISGLTAFTTYHYRAVSTDGSTTWTGGDVSFVASDLRDADKTQADFQEGTLTDVEADAGDYLRLADTDVLSFNGVDDYVNTPATIPNDAFTLEVRVKPFVDDLKGILTTTAGTDGIRLITYENNFQILLCDSGTSYKIQSGSFTVGQYTHLAVTFDGTTLRLYVDGTEVGSKSASKTQGSELHIGGYYIDENAHRWDGVINEVRVWSTVHTQTEIQDNMNKRFNGDESGLIYYYKLDEGTGTTATDSAGTNDGTINGATWVADEPLYFMNSAEDNNRLSPQLDLSNLGTIGDTLIKWTETLNSQTITIETRVSTDGGTNWTAWAACTNGIAIPDLTSGTDVSNGLLECKQSLSTSDVTATPKLHSLSVMLRETVPGQIYVSLESMFISPRDPLFGLASLSIEQTPSTRIFAYPTKHAFGRTVSMKSMKIREGAVKGVPGAFLHVHRQHIAGHFPTILPKILSMIRMRQRQLRPLILFDGMAIWNTPFGRQSLRRTDPHPGMKFPVSYKRTGPYRPITPRIGVGQRAGSGKIFYCKWDPRLIPRIVMVLPERQSWEGRDAHLGKGILPKKGRIEYKAIGADSVILKQRHIPFERLSVRSLEAWVSWQITYDLLVSKIFVLTLTGDVDGLPDMEIPVPSIQIRRRHGRPTMVQVSFPDDGLLGDIEARNNGDLVISQGGILANGLRQLTEITRVDLDDIRQDQGGRNTSITLTGRRTVSNDDPRQVELEEVTYRSVQQGKRRYRTEVDPWIRPGDTVQVGEEEIEVGTMVYTIGVGREQMEIVEA